MLHQFCLYMRRTLSPISLSTKLRDMDAALINGEYTRVSTLIENDPMKLWNAIHTKGSKISLVRTTYHRLKTRVNEIAPDVVKSCGAEFRKHKAQRKFAKERTDKILGTKKSRFKRISGS